MTLTEIATAINARSTADEGAGFINDFAGTYGISREEAERIAARSSSLDEFEAIWENGDWWTDANN